MRGSASVSSFAAALAVARGDELLCDDARTVARLKAIARPRATTWRVTLIAPERGSYDDELAIADAAARSVVAG
jgi:hypothetical protein